MQSPQSFLNLIENILRFAKALRSAKINLEIFKFVFLVKIFVPSCLTF